jgi:hypothetical protein
VKPLQFFGCSDDTFGEYGRTSLTHDNCASGKPIRFLVQNGTDRLIVVGQYKDAPGASWTVGVDMVDEDVPLPPWPIRIRAGKGDECGYSPTLEIDAPEGAEVQLFGNRD